MKLSEITPGRAQRALFSGGTRCGKSTLLDMMLRLVIDRDPDLRVLLCDSKPRFRAAQYPSGLSCANEYESWAPGPTIPNSVRLPLESSDPFRFVWRNHRQIAIAQTEEEDEYERICEIAAVFYKMSGPRLIIVDEFMDYFGITAAPRWPAARIFTKAIRAGGEKGCGVWTGSQRTIGVPAQSVSEIDWLYLFRQANNKDMARLWDNGLPKKFGPPAHKHNFRAWERDNPDHIRGGKMVLPRSYVRELSAT